MHYADMAPITRAIAGLLEQLALCCGKRVFARIYLPCRKLDQHLAYGIAKLLLKDKLSAIKDRDNNRCTLMNNILPCRFMPIRQTNAIQTHIKQLAAKYLSPFYLGLA